MASLEKMASMFRGSIYLLKYCELPAQPGMVFNSKAPPCLPKGEDFSNSSLETTFASSPYCNQYHFLALPKGGSPVSVGRYFSTSGNSNGKCFLSIICGIPST